MLLSGRRSANGHRRNLVTGRIRPETFLQNLEASVPLSIEAIFEQIAGPLDMGRHGSEGVLQVVNSNMIRAIGCLGEKGYDPREFTLIAYGGSGPLHAAALAKISKSMGNCPFLAGTFSGTRSIDVRQQVRFRGQRLISQAKSNPGSLPGYSNPRRPGLTVSSSGKASKSVNGF